MKRGIGVRIERVRLEFCEDGRLLREGAKRPRDGRTTKKRDEFPSPHWLSTTTRIITVPFVTDLGQTQRSPCIRATSALPLKRLSLAKSKTQRSAVTRHPHSL